MQQAKFEIPVFPFLKILSPTLDLRLYLIGVDKLDIEKASLMNELSNVLCIVCICCFCIHIEDTGI